MIYLFIVLILISAPLSAFAIRISPWQRDITKPFGSWQENLIWILWFIASLVNVGAIILLAMEVDTMTNKLGYTALTLVLSGAYDFICYKFII